MTLRNQKHFIIELMRRRRNYKWFTNMSNIPRKLHQLLSLFQHEHTLSLSVKQAEIKINDAHLCFGELHYRPQFWHHLVPHLDKGNFACRETEETHREKQTIKTITDTFAGASQMPINPKPKSSQQWEGPESCPVKTVDQIHLHPIWIQSSGDRPGHKDWEVYRG